MGVGVAWDGMSWDGVGWVGCDGMGAMVLGMLLSLWTRRDEFCVAFGFLVVAYAEKFRARCGTNAR